MEENCDKCLLLFPKAQEEVLKCLVLSKSQLYSVYFYKRVKKVLILDNLIVDNKSVVTVALHVSTYF